MEVPRIARSSCTRLIKLREKLHDAEGDSEIEVTNLMAPTLVPIVGNKYKFSWEIKVLTHDKRGTTYPIARNLLVAFSFGNTCDGDYTIEDYSHKVRKPESHKISRKTKRRFGLFKPRLEVEKEVAFEREFEVSAKETPISADPMRVCGRVWRYPDVDLSKTERGVEAYDSDLIVRFLTPNESIYCALEVKVEFHPGTTLDRIRNWLENRFSNHQKKTRDSYRSLKIDEDQVRDKTHDITCITQY